MGTVVAVRVVVAMEAFKLLNTPGTQTYLLQRDDEVVIEKAVTRHLHENNVRLKGFGGTIYIFNETVVIYGDVDGRGNSGRADMFFVIDPNTDGGGRFCHIKEGTNSSEWRRLREQAADGRVYAVIIELKMHRAGVATEAAVQVRGYAHAAWAQRAHRVTS